LLTREVPPAIVSDIQLQLKLSDRIILIINSPKVIPHRLNSSEPTKIVDHMRFNRAK
jgi:hypothetical protein